MESSTGNKGSDVAPRWAPGKTSLRQVADQLGIRAASTVGVGLNQLFGSRAEGAFGILMYHRVAAVVKGVTRPTISVTAEQFRNQMVGLLDRGTVIWPLSKVLSLRAKGEPVPAKVAVVTFDDGFEGVYTHAWPVLRELKIPATVFVSTAYLDSDAPFPFDHWGVANRMRVPAEAYRPMKTWQVTEMHADGLVEIGAHTHTHEDFRGRPDALRRDLDRCVDILRTMLGEERLTFAFPYGAPWLGFASDELVAAAKATGVVCGLTTASELVDAASDPFRWGRLNVFPWDTGASLTAKLDGWYSWAPQQRRRIVAGVARLRTWLPQLPWPTGGQAAKRDRRQSLDANGGSAAQRTASAPAGRRRPATPHHADLVPRQATLVSVIVPTFDRAHWLGEALATLIDQETDGRFAHEIIVVDNASTDATRATVEEAIWASPVPIKYVYEPTPGDGAARNRGIESAAGQWLAFFDDDQLAEPAWLNELLTAAEDTGASIVGGPVHLDLTPEERVRLGPICRSALREITFYPTRQPYVNRDLPGGGNSLVAKEVFEKVGSFCAAMTEGSSDTEFFVRARQAGYSLWYAPEAVIRHRIPPSRLTASYLRWDSLAGAAGQAASVDAKKRSHATMLLLCAARAGQAVLVNVPLLVVGWLRGDAGEVLGRRTLLWRAEGYIRMTLAMVAPKLFPQHEFFASIEFRNGRVVEQSACQEIEAVG